MKMTLARGMLAAVAAAALAAGTAAAQDKSLTVASWGGSYQDAQSKALFQPAAKAMGIELKEETYGGMADVRLQVQTGAVTYDIVVSGTGSAARAAEEGLLEPLDYDVIDVSNFAPTAYTDYCLGGDVFSTVYAWNPEKYRRGWAEQLGRLLGREEVPRHARLSRQGRRRARAGADGRRRAARGSLQGARFRGGHQARHRQDPRAEAAHRGLLELGRPAGPADEGRRGRHDHRLERPLRQRQGRRRQGRLQLQPGAARL